ncbi:MAG TPA: hypothetical protein VF440_02425 [Novosphingobium sp.]
MMPNHVHLVLVPDRIDGLRAALSKVHRAYAGRITRANSAPDISGKAASAAWRWMSRICWWRSGMSRSIRCAPGWSRGPRRGVGRACTLCSIPRGAMASPTPPPVLERIPDFAALLSSGEDARLSDALWRFERTGRPIGASAFLDRVEAILGRDPKPAKRGPKLKEN